MENSVLESASRVNDACMRLICELGIEANKNNPYFLPYTNYVLSWSNYLPINTIIIGQNPYPQNIYPEYGAAFAYDKSKSYCPQSVRVLARDIYNYDSTDLTTSTECFRDSWRLLEIGVVLINESVYDKISSDKKNTRAIKEMEAQCRALQVLIAESYFLGQQTITCIGMGIPAACMTSIIRSWYPKDLFRMRVMTCKNPAARDIGDMPSHQITIGKTAVSKVLSEIVRLYSTMPPPRNTAQERRRKQNEDALKKGVENLSIAASHYETELQSFEDRLRSSREGGTSSSTVDEILQSSGTLRRATDKFKNAVISYNVSLLMIVDTIERTVQSQDNNKQSNTPPSSTVVVPTRTGGPRRRAAPKSVEPSQIEPVPEVPEPVIEDVKPKVEESIPSPAPSRARRRAPVRTMSYAPSNAETEYTIASVQRPLGSGDMSEVESIIMKVFATWCNNNSSDPVNYELLSTAAEERSILSPLVQSLVTYVRDRKSQDTEYDAYDELTDPDSQSSIWARKNLTPIS